eukprot:494613_1
MISIKELKKFNYLNEQLGFTITWDALYEFNQKYTSYKLYGVGAAKNIGSWDFHCGVTQQQTDDNNCIFIDNIRYWSRSKCIKAKKYLVEMSDKELLEMSFAHRCEGDILGGRKELTVPFDKKCDSPEAKINGRLFDSTKHPQTLKNELLNREGFIFCFRLSFSSFIKYIATLYEVDLSVVQNWGAYDSKINPFWKDDNIKKHCKLTMKYQTSKKVKLIHAAFLDNKMDEDTDNNTDNDHQNTQIPYPVPIQLNLPSLNTDNMNDILIEANNNILNNMNQIETFNDVDMNQVIHEVTELEIEAETISYTYPHPDPLPDPEIGRIKTEKLIVDCFRKELIPFIDCNYKNTEVQNALNSICQKYFFRPDQISKHKDVLLKMRKEDPFLSYFDTVQLPILPTKYSKINSSDMNSLTPIFIAQKWISSFIDNPLECPFTA